MTERGLFYLSFADEKRPRGQQFVGATIVDADDAKSAFERARELGLVPTGVQTAIVALWTQEGVQVRITALEQLPSDSRALYRRLASREEIMEGKWRSLDETVRAAFVCSDHSTLSD